MKINLIIFSAFSALIFLSSCEKEPGEGGNARIRGKVWVKDYDPYFTVVEREYFGQDVNVMIYYGDNISPDDKIETNANGEFEFQYLRKGEYTIMIYSDVFPDSINPSGSVSVDTTVTIENREDIIDVGTLEIQSK